MSMMKIPETVPDDIIEDLFVPELVRESRSEEASTPSSSPWKDAFRRLRASKGVVLSAILILIMASIAIVGPAMSKYSYDEQNLAHSNLPPKIPGLQWLGFDGKDRQDTDVYQQRNVDTAYWFGTDEFGRDLWTRVWKGMQISLFIALIAALLDLFIGVLYGGLSAYYGGRVDSAMERIIEILMGIPSLIVIVLFAIILEPGILSITLAMIITGWVGMARIVRGQILKLKVQEFVLAARTLGVSNSRIIWKHLLPNAMGPIVVNVMFDLPTAIFFEAFLSFIGLGLQAPLASLGVLINDGFKQMRMFPYKLVIPAVMISLILICFNLLADGLRDALDPKTKK
ncbi:oligopeptide transport system permease protein [Paenibacillus forsythiae]|uniref:Oligopeptide transport system permease protein n=1 Tax=Paenibacillus forsythiae TaxID=365616 RepID=A0ABU3H2K5_9BACL|nr:oligopeptide ABC transporter permease [Paenibacillus forsythiae]MDT3424970.1 oligopeptide transport system permease protein [Paenibacillus forsythiae]